MEDQDLVLEDLLLEQEDHLVQPLTLQPDQHHLDQIMDSTAHLDLDQAVELQEAPQPKEGHSVHLGPLEVKETMNPVEEKNLELE